MVLLIERLGKLYSRMENHHHPSETDDLSASSLRAFRSDVSNGLNQLLLNVKPGSEALSFSWIQQCLQLLPHINRAFAKLVVDIDYPMNRWESATVDNYLTHSLHLLELLNAVSSSLSHLANAQLSFAHALNVLEDSPSLAMKHLKVIHPQGSSKYCKGEEIKEDFEEKFSFNKEKVVNQALMDIKYIGFWACGVVLATLSGEAKPYVEIKPSIAGLNYALLFGLDSCVSDIIVEKGMVLEETKELNDAASFLSSAITSGKSSDAAAKKLEKKSRTFKKQLEAMKMEVENLFSKALADRNELLHGLRQTEQQHQLHSSLCT